MRIKSKIPLKAFSTFGIGGAARYFIEAATKEDLQDALKWADRLGIKTFVLGKGSNCLFDDRGFNGLVILNKIDFCFIEKNKIRAGAGYSLSKLAFETAKRGLSGLEYGAGIPASIGGAVYLNCGAFSREMAGVVDRVVFINEKGEERVYTRSQLDFGYRFSSFQKMNGAIAEVFLTLNFSVEASSLLKDLFLRRRSGQPLGEKSLGSIFLNPEGRSAGYLIEKCGLKGMAWGGAVISPQHANVIINKGGATAKEVIELIEKIKLEVEKKFNILLREEIRVVPFEGDF